MKTPVSIYLRTQIDRTGTSYVYNILPCRKDVKSFYKNFGIQ